MHDTQLKDAQLKDAVAAELDATRRRTLALLEPLGDDDLRRQHSALMSPLVWDLAHVGNYEDIWLLRGLGHEGVGARYDHMYDAFRHPRPDRPRLPLLGPDDARAYIASVRGRALDVLDRVDLDPGVPLLSRGFVYGMVVQHEHQHVETMLATLQLKAGPVDVGPVEAPPAGAVVAPAEVLVGGGPFVMGTDTEPWAYDNERPAHEVHVDPFLIDTAPVTNHAFLEFIDAGGYHDARWWSDDGWRWCREARLEHPEFWRRESASSWSVLRFGRRAAVDLDEPVQHVCWYEADAYARWRGRRLPSEAEWEKAASWDPERDRKRRYPWGDDAPEPSRANLGRRQFGPAPVGAYPGGASAYGCVQLVGDVWEWTASDFTAYPGFESFPYREYSEVFLGPDYKVLRGGSWATDPIATRNTFRNWDYPIRRQIFAGFRTARDAV
ncbi:MAG: ergothioneine biosynthesis protein EgtB [Actinobacteria bacterium]|nr:MAG: ergothioneine biosynthesis protein EgtB [Actinomycetota bacterium]